MLSPTENIELGIPMLRVKRSGAGIKPGQLRYCDSIEAFSTTGIKFWEPHHIHIISNDPLKPGDWCMFYNSLSEVIEVNGETAKIRSITVVSKEDAEFLNSMKGKGTVKEGTFSTMTHSFGVAQLPKVIASTNKTIMPNAIVPEAFVKEFIDKLFNPERPNLYINLNIEAEPALQKIATGEETTGSESNYNLKPITNNNFIIIK